MRISWFWLVLLILLQDDSVLGSLSSEINPTWLANTTNIIREALEAIKRGDDSATRAWHLLRSHTDYQTLFGDPELSSILCLILSQLPPELREDGRVRLALNELDLYKEPKSQSACILTPAFTNPIYQEAYQRFLEGLPLLKDPRQWPAIIEIWAGLSNVTQRQLLLNVAKGLTQDTDPTSLLGQFCAMDMVRGKGGIKDEFITLLPVFNVKNGQTIREAATVAGGSSYCEDFFGRADSDAFKRLLHDTRQELANDDIPKVTLSSAQFNNKLSGRVSVAELTSLIKFSLSLRDEASLAQLVDTSDLLLVQDSLELNDIFRLAAYLVNPQVHPEIFTLFFRRAGNLTRRDMQKYNSFLFETLREATQWPPETFFRWYIELTLLQPTLATRETIAIPFWTELMKPPPLLPDGTRFKEGQVQLKLPDRTSKHLTLLELVLAKSRCVTKQPLVEPAKCESLRRLVIAEELRASDMLNNGWWRIASMTNYTADDLKKYLRRGNHTLGAVSWALTKVPQLTAKEARALQASSNLSVKALVYLWMKLTESPSSPGLSTAGPRDDKNQAIGSASAGLRPCRTKNGQSQSVSLDLLQQSLDKDDDKGGKLFPASERVPIIKSLISLVTGTNLDHLAFVPWGENHSIERVFYSILEAYCGQWEGVFPAIILE